MGKKKEHFFKKYFLILLLVFLGSCSVPSDEEEEEPSEFFYGEVYTVVAVRIEGQDNWDRDFTGDRQIIFENNEESRETISGDKGQFSVSLFDFTRDDSNFESCSGELVGEFEVISIQEENIEESDTYSIFNPYINTEENTVAQEFRYELLLDINGSYDLEDSCPNYPSSHIASIVRLDNDDIIYIDFTVGLQYYMELENKEEI